MFQTLTDQHQVHPWKDPSIPFRRNYRLHIMIVLFWIFWILAAIHPTQRKIWMAENILPVGLFLFLLFTYAKYRFSNLSYLLIFIFLCFHLYGGHYTYNQTPFDDWIKVLFHTKRSYYDRVVHFLFGVFWTYPIYELFTRTTVVKKGIWIYVIPVIIVFACSSFYEIIEWSTTLLPGRSGNDYMGMQGDIFDSQKDMGLGLLGSLFAIGILWKKRKRIHKFPN